MFCKSKEPRMVFCNNRLCIHNHWYGCELKNIALDDNGCCQGYSPVFCPSTIEEEINRNSVTAENVGEVKDNSITSTGGGKIGF